MGIRALLRRIVNQQRASEPTRVDPILSSPRHGRLCAMRIRAFRRRILDWTHPFLNTTPFAQLAPRLTQTALRDFRTNSFTLFPRHHRTTPSRPSPYGQNPFRDNFKQTRGVRGFPLLRLHYARPVTAAALAPPALPAPSPSPAAKRHPRPPPPTQRRIHNHTRSTAPAVGQRLARFM